MKTIQSIITAFSKKFGEGINEFSPYDMKDIEAFLIHSIADLLEGEGSRIKKKKSFVYREDFDDGSVNVCSECGNEIEDECGAYCLKETDSVCAKHHKCEFVNEGIDIGVAHLAEVVKEIKSLGK